MTTLSIVPQHGETAAEAMSRVHAGLVLSVLRQCDDPRVPFEALTPGDLIRHASEWWTIAVLRDDRMLLASDEGRVEWVHPTDGETFLHFGSGF